MQKNIFKIVKSYKLALIVLVVALIGVQTLNAGAVGIPRTVPEQCELESSGVAKRSLAKLGSKDPNRIKDARARAAAQRSFTALKAVASNTTKAREASLIASFNRTIMDLKALPPHKNPVVEKCDNQYELCIEICKEIGSNCDLCSIGQNSCYLDAWFTAWMDENDPTNGD